MRTLGVFPDEEPSKEARALVEQVEADGGRALAIYREPVGGHWQIFCSFEQTITKLLANIEKLDVDAVRLEDIQRTALVAVAGASE